MAALFLFLDTGGSKVPLSLPATSSDDLWVRTMRAMTALRTFGNSLD